MQKTLTFNELLAIISQRIADGKKDSYCYEIAENGVEKICRKIGEEAVEVLIAAFIAERENDKKSHEELVGEICDLFFHTLILMAQKNVTMEEILQEFAKRNNKNDARKN
ncbi:MAG TPA: phosphoribosyl-ATP diphosphatase [Rickettsiales bacterium]|nr:phosphoribosyl-ATP diphosphatase [Rickettsiales bacterium]